MPYTLRHQPHDGDDQGNANCLGNGIQLKTVQRRQQESCHTYRIHIGEIIGIPMRLQFSIIKLISKSALWATIVAPSQNFRNSGKISSIGRASITMLSLILVSCSIRNGIGT